MHHHLLASAAASLAKEAVCAKDKCLGPSEPGGQILLLFVIKVNPSPSKDSQIAPNKFLELRLTKCELRFPERRIYFRDSVNSMKNSL